MGIEVTYDVLEFYFVERERAKLKVIIRLIFLNIN